MPLPVIGSVLLDGGQGLRIRPGRRKVSPMSKKIFRRCNKMPLHGPGCGLSDPQFAAQNHIRPCQRNALRGDASQRDAPYHSPQTLGIRQSQGGNSHSEFASAPHCVLRLEVRRFREVLQRFFRQIAAKHPHGFQETILRCRNAFEAVAAEVARVAYRTFAFANPKDVFASRCCCISWAP
jgi:hypothetical protein